MAIIRVNCSLCGEQNLAPAQVWIELREEDVHYVFDCPDCSTQSAQPVFEPYISQLIEVGCEYVPAVQQFVLDPITCDYGDNLVSRLWACEDIVGTLLTES